MNIKDGMPCSRQGVRVAVSFRVGSSLLSQSSPDFL